MAGDAAGYARRHSGEMSEATLELAAHVISSLQFGSSFCCAMLEQARKIVHTVVAYRYTFIRAFDGPTGQIASASPRNPAIFAGAVRST